MRKYQYYEFCRINASLSQEICQEMASLSSEVHMGTHSVSYVYNHGDFPGHPKQLLLKYFDVFFYMSHHGTLQLIFKYLAQQVAIDELKKYCIKDVISCEQQGQHILLDIHIHHQEVGRWIEAEGLLLDLLPLYNEIAAKNYQLLRLVAAIHDEFTGNPQNSLSTVIAKTKCLSSGQQTFLESVGVSLASRV